MRTKITILSAAALAAGLISSNAQVFSANVVGYVNISVTNQYALVQNPLDAGNNSVSNVFSGAPAGLLGGAILTFNGTTFAQNNLDLFGTGWGNPTDTIAPGRGFFIQNPTPGSPFTVTFVGTVQQGLTTNALANGYSLVGAHTPVADFIGNLGYAGSPGDYAYKFKGSGFVLYSLDLFGTGWSAQGQTDFDVVKGPKLNVGDSLFYNNQSGAPVNWVSNFTVQ